MMQVTRPPTPFSELDSPTTVATPSCCCCCCCCLATISTAPVVAGRVVHRDVAEHHDSGSGNDGLTVLATLAPVAAIIGVVVLASWLDPLIGGAVLVAVGIAMGLLVATLTVLRVRAGVSVPHATWWSVAFTVSYAVALVAEVVLVLITIGLFWLTIPLWITVAVKATRRRGTGTGTGTGQHGAGGDGPWPPPARGGGAW